MPSSASDERLQGHFCSDTVFDLSNRVLKENEIEVLEKGLDFAPIQRKINKTELCKDFEESFRRMWIKWNFRKEPSQNFSVVPVFALKLFRKPSSGHLYLELLFSQDFKEIQDSLRYSNLSEEEWGAAIYEHLSLCTHYSHIADLFKIDTNSFNSNQFNVWQIRDNTIVQGKQLERFTF